MGPAPLAAALQRRKSLLEAETAIQGRDLAPWVFTNRVDRPIDALNLVHRVWLPLLEKAGLRRIRFHDLRHTYALGPDPAWRVACLREGSAGS